jgi:uncharacterized protein GlcG (DUF336 family)
MIDFVCRTASNGTSGRITPASTACPNLKSTFFTDDSLRAQRAEQFLTGVIALAGALPVKVGDDVIAAIGVCGAPGGEKDEACAKAAIHKVADQLK